MPRPKAMERRGSPRQKRPRKRGRKKARADELAERELLGLKPGDISLESSTARWQRCLSGLPFPWEKTGLRLSRLIPSHPGDSPESLRVRPKATATTSSLIGPLETPVEFGADYYSGSGRKSPNRWYGYIVRVTDGHWILHACSTGKAACKEAEKYLASLVTDAVAGTATTD